MSVSLNGQQGSVCRINDNNRDVMQVLNLSQHAKNGKNHIHFEVKGSANVMYQVMTRHYRPWKKIPAPRQKSIEMDIQYDRTTLKKDDTIIATATMRYRGKKPTFMVIIDLGIPPGFRVDPGDFAELLGEDKIKRYSITARQVTLYLGRVQANDVFTCRYQLKAKYPLRVKTPKSTAYEYYSPHITADARPVELVVK